MTGEDDPMFFYEGMQCPVCGQPFSEKDDIVACPHCGAPHHRACWQAEGHCHFESAHGTAEQWSREQAQPQSTDSSVAAQSCPYCGAENTEFAEFCSHCGRPLTPKEWASADTNDTAEQPPYREYRPFFAPSIDPYGGVPKTERIEDESVEDIAATVGQNTPYYLPKFYQMANGASKMMWNWAAFLLTPYWLLFRKNYVHGALMILFQICSTVLDNLVFTRLFANATDTSYAALMQYTEQLWQNDAARPYLYLIAGLTLIDLLLRVVFGLFGNYVYMGTVLGRVRRLRAQEPNNYKIQLPAAGGVSFVLAWLAYFVLQMVSMFSQML